MWVCVRSRILWVSPMNSHVMLGVPPAAATPTDFYRQRFWGFLFWRWNHGSCRLSGSPVVPPGLSTRKCGITQCTSWCLATSSLPLLPVSAPIISLDECFFFNSLVVGLPYSSILWQFWLFFVFKFVVVLLLVVQGSKVYPPTPPSWPEVSNLPFLILGRTF